MTTKPAKGQLPEFVKNAVSKHKGSGCLEWPFAKNGARGYGHMTIRQRNVYVHRFAFETFVGKIPKGKFLLHSCDNPRCFNPRHLSVGTQFDNIWQAIKRKRFQRGDTGSASKLTGEQVREIRLLTAQGILTRAAIGKRFGVARTTVNEIHLKRTWRE